jgi:hypothetical protein
MLTWNNFLATRHRGKKEPREDGIGREEQKVEARSWIRQNEMETSQIIILKTSRLLRRKRDKKEEAGLTTEEDAGAEGGRCD